MNLLIMDKDVTEARRLRKLLDWEKLGFDAVYTAYSQEAFGGIAKEKTFDLLICGESFMDKVRLKWVEEFRQNNERAEIIFTGTRPEGENLRTLFHLGTADFLQKPVKKEDLAEAVELILQRAEKRKKEEQEQRYGKYWERNHVLIQEVFWKNLCLNRIGGGPEELSAAAAQVNVAMEKDSPYRMILITVKNQDEMYSVWGEDACQAAIQNLARAVVKKKGASSKVIVIYTRVVILLDEDEFGTERKKCQRLLEVCRKELGAEILCYLSEDIFCEELSSTYSALLEYSKDDVLQQESVTRVDRSRQRSWGGIEIPSEWSSILYGSRPQNLVKVVRDYLIALGKAGALSERSIRIFQQDMLQLFFTYMEKKELRAHELYDNPEIYKLYKIAILSIDGMCRWVKTCTDYITGQLSKKSGSGDERCVRQVKDYIRSHLKEEITMEMLSQVTFLNPDYLTRVFKRQTGMSVKEYLMKKRMETARNLLQTTADSVSEIGAEAGYDNCSYFIKLFRKYYGQTPKQFRKSLQNRK